MRYRALNVNYWQQGDNKCQYWLGEKARIILTLLIAGTYAIYSLAQKLQYFCSPIKTLTGETK